MTVSRAQFDAVTAHLDAEFDAAAAFARANSPDHVWTSHPTEQEQIAKAVVDSKANVMRELRAAFERNPDELPNASGDTFTTIAAQAERDVRDLSGYSQQATVEQVLKDTASATAQTVADGATAAASAVGNAASFSLGLIWKIVPWPVWALAGVVALGVGYVYLRPLLPARNAA